MQSSTTNDLCRLFGKACPRKASIPRLRLSTGCFSGTSMTSRPHSSYLLLLSTQISNGSIIGIVPAFQFTRTSISETLKQGSGRTGGTAIKQHTRKALVISEVALSLVLLIGAGLMIRSFWKLQNVDPGFDSSNTLTMSLALTWIRYSEPYQRLAFMERTIEQIRAVPGVVSVGITTKVPLTGGGSTQPFSVEG